VPEGVSFDQAAVVEPTAVACHALSRSKLDLKGKKVLVLGAGTIGNLVAQVAKARGAARVMITDLSEFRLSKAAKCGIDVALDTSKKPLSDAILDEFGPDKADLILECVGVQPTMTDAINNARKGSTIIVVGVFPDDAKINMGFVQDRELSLVGTLMYRKEDYIEAMDLIANKRINVDELITDYFEFKDYDAAYKHIQNQGDKIMKVMIKLAD
jgi:L-iditol 2-dehydrogenase